MAPAEIDASAQGAVEQGRLSQARLERYRAAQALEGEVLLAGADVAPGAIESGGMRAMKGVGRGLQVAGVAMTAYDMSKAATQSYEQGSAKPLASETVRQVGGWGGAVAGAKLGAMAGVAVGIETGPGAIAFGIGGGVIGGVAGYSGADWIVQWINK